MSNEVLKRSVVIAGHRTSVSMEEAFWKAFKDIAKARSVSVNRLIEQVDSGRQGNLSSAIRVFVLETLLAERQSAASAPATPQSPAATAHG
jgi:predicted DNA-binding ribbon-helix-helix protein